jgi:hypothetical protein
MIFDTGDIMLCLLGGIITGEHKKDLISVLQPQLLRDGSDGHSEHGALDNDSQSPISKK